MADAQISSLLECSLCSEILLKPITLALEQIIQAHANTRRQLEERVAAEAEAEKERLAAGDDAASLAVIPLFVLGSDALFPGVPMPLHVFEPRYRLMIRRCMEGSRRFGVVPVIGTTATNDAVMAEVGTVALIRDERTLPDGRSLIDTVGDRRFRVIGVPWTEEGYAVAKVEFFEDVATHMDQAEQQQLKQDIDSLRATVVGALVGALSVVERHFGGVPADDSQFVWWTAKLLQLSTTDQIAFLKLTSDRSRTSFLQERSEPTALAEHLAGAYGSRCSIQ